MNVLIASPDANSGGVASVVRNLTQYLRSKGHGVEFIHSGGSLVAKRRTNKMGFAALDLRMQMPIGERHPAVTLPLFAALFPIGLIQLAWIIWKNRVRAVNIHYPSEEQWFFAVCRRFLRFRLVCSIHGAELFPYGKARAQYPWSTGALLKRADRIVTPSADLRRKVLELFPEYANKTVFIHNAIEVEKFSRAPRKANGVRRRYILSVSAYKVQKGLDVLIRAMKQVAERHPDVKLILVGEDAPMRTELESLSAQLGLTKQIEFHGKKSQSEVAELLHGCEVFVLPSRFETFGIAILEAMACGRPVVASNTGGMPEIVQDGRNGILVEPEDSQALADALITLIEDPALRGRMGETAFQDVDQRFDLDSMGESYERALGLHDSVDETDTVTTAGKNLMRVEPS